VGNVSVTGVVGWQRRHQRQCTIIFSDSSLERDRRGEKKADCRLITHEQQHQVTGVARVECPNGDVDTN